METEVLYMAERRGQEPDPNYAKEFDAEVVESSEDFVALDRTSFYAEGGGQPYDTGMLRWPGGESMVVKVLKDKGQIKHFVDVTPGVSRVRGIVDWDRRYAHMRMHTCRRILSGIAFKTYGARTVGNQIHFDRSRVDLSPAEFSSEDVRRLQEECNHVISQSVDVNIFEEDRLVVENRMADRSLMNLIPKIFARLRVVQIGRYDLFPCGGTHVRNTTEIGVMRITERRNKGRATERIVFELLSPKKL